MTESLGLGDRTDLEESWRSLLVLFSLHMRIFSVLFGFCGPSISFTMMESLGNYIDFVCRLVDNLLHWILLKGWSLCHQLWATHGRSQEQGLARKESSYLHPFVVDSIFASLFSFFFSLPPPFPLSFLHSPFLFRILPYWSSWSWTLRLKWSLPQPTE